MEVSLGFLIIGGIFVVSLLKSLGKMLTRDWDQAGFTAGAVLKIFMIPLISLVALVLFIVYGIPYFES